MMKRLIKKIGICLFTLAILLGTMPLTSVKATGQSTVRVDEAGELIKKALDGKVSNDITAQEIEEIAKEALEGKSITDLGMECELYKIDIPKKHPATENSWVKLNTAPRKVGTYRVKISVGEDEFYHSAEIVKEFEITEVETAVPHEVPPTGDMNSIGFNIGILLVSARSIAYSMKRNNKKRKV